MKRCVPAAALLLTLAGCGGGGPSISEQLTEAGWKKEPVLTGAEQEIGKISPAKCGDLYALLNRREETDKIQGYARDEGSYLLIRDWAGSGLVEQVHAAAANCGRMEMAYGPVTLVYTVTVEESGGRTRLRMTAKQDDQLEMDVLVAAFEKNGTQRLVRVMNPTGVGETEREGVGRAVLGWSRSPDRLEGEISLWRAVR